MITIKKLGLQEGNYRAFSGGCRNYCETHSNDAKVLEVIQNSPFYWAAYHMHGVSVLIKSFETIRGILHLREDPRTEVMFCGEEKAIDNFMNKNLKKINGHNFLLPLEQRVPEVAA